jgi:hypothetical protein
MDKSRTNSVLLVLLERSERFRARTRSRALGVKCRWYRGCLASYAWTVACSWVP